ncbi:MAG: CBS domain-containing protein [Candidatus Woesearchaeota archaeon]
MKVRDLMQDFLEVDADTSVCRLAKKMEEKHTSSALVTRNGTIVGIVTEKDIVKKVVANCKDSLAINVFEIMNSPVITISADADILEATDLMDRKVIRRLAVVDSSGKIIGKITARNVARNYRYLLGRKLTASQVQYTRNFE